MNLVTDSTSWFSIFLENHGIKVKLFADDVKLYPRVVNDADIIKLQSALDTLSDWAATWQLTISVEKCCILNIGSIRTNIQNTVLLLLLRY